jgi:hypothetical protein
MYGVVVVMSSCTTSPTANERLSMRLMLARHLPPVVRGYLRASPLPMQAGVVNKVHAASLREKGRFKEGG